MNKEFVKQLHGISNAHINSTALEKPVHKQLVEPINQLKADASSAGFDLRLASGFRDFERQRMIWNEKLQGKRPVYDSNECLLDLDDLSLIEQIYAVMRWSALPGASRHHWGSDVDIYDAASLPDGYTLELSVKETTQGGIMADFYRWLDEYLVKQQEWYRPYAVDSGGVSPEPWHLSYRPLAQEYTAAMTCDSLLSIYQQEPIIMGDLVLKHLPELYQRFIITDR